MNIKNVKIIQHIMKVILIPLVLMINPVYADDFPIGTWQGEMSVGGNKIPLIFHISLNNDNQPKAVMDSPAQGAKDIPVKKVSVDGNKVTLEVAVANATFEGMLEKNSTMIKGNWQQSGQTFPLILVKMSDDITGLWRGKLQGASTELSIEISMNSKNETIAFLSPNGGISKVVVAALKTKQGQLSFEVPAEGVSYMGRYNKEAGHISGTFSQGEREFTLNFLKVVGEEAKQVKLNRPQHPVKPYRYNVKEVIFQNKQAGIELAGTLTTPKGTDSYPAVVLISGSGPQDRDQTFMGHKTFLVLADHLTKSGIAVLRFDDRGFAKSTGDFASASSVDFASDVNAAVQFLKQQANIDKTNIGLIGHSEGGLIAPMVASQSKDIAFITLMAGPGISGNEIAIAQIKTILSVNGLSEPAAEAGSNITRQLNLTVKHNKQAKNLASQLTTTYQQAWLALPKDIQAELKQVGGGKISQARINSLSSPWSRYFLSHQPKEYIAKLLIPVMALHGNKDVQMSASTNLQAIKQALKPSKHNLIIEMAGLNHLFQTANTGFMSEYATLSETIAPEVLKKITQWILKVTDK
ncbi:MAG: alpha/beta fold hydrolase [Colwellia sp.]|nr:alpha/beta fold hydrolase [Colwellia sp.]